MRKNFTLNSGLLSLVSAVVTLVFIFLAAGSFLQTGVRQNVIYDPETGNHSELTYFRTAKHSDSVRFVRKIVGKRNEYGDWTGTLKITNWEDSTTQYVESAEFYRGERDGSSTLTIERDGKTEHKRTDNYVGGVHVGRIDKSALIDANGISTWQILDNEFAWYVHFMNGLGFSADELKALADTMDLLIDMEEFSAYEFEDYYDDIVDDLEWLTHEEILGTNEMVKWVVVMENMKKNSFRKAVVEHYLWPERSIHDNVVNNYPSYYRSNFSSDTRKQEFESFCYDLQDTLKNFPPVDPSDPLLPDSVDSYLFAIFDTALNEDSDDDELSAKLDAELLKSASATSVSGVLQGSASSAAHNKLLVRRMGRALMKEGSSALTSRLSVSDYNFNSMARTMFMQLYRFGLNKSDILMEAANKAWILRHEAVTVPVLITQGVEYNTATSVDISGFIHWDGGAEITSRGVVWATYPDPTLLDNKVESGAATDAFTVTVSGLEKGTRYYARSFVVSDAGNAYGNGVEFVASLPSGIGETAGNLNEFLVYPNPAGERATVRFSLASSERVTLQVTDLSGKEMLNRRSETFPQGSHQFNLDLTSFRSGIYICTLTTATERLEQKIIVNR